MGRNQIQALSDGVGAVHEGSWTAGGTGSKNKELCQSGLEGTLKNENSKNRKRGVKMTKEKKNTQGGGGGSKRMGEVYEGGQVRLKMQTWVGGWGMWCKMQKIQIGKEEKRGGGVGLRGRVHT